MKFDFATVSIIAELELSTASKIPLRISFLNSRSSVVNPKTAFMVFFYEFESLKMVSSTVAK
jgi:hypothetical protein